MKLEINDRREARKFTNMQKFKKPTCMDKQWVNKTVKREIQKFQEKQQKKPLQHTKTGLQQNF